MAFSYLQNILCPNRKCGCGNDCSKFVLKELDGNSKLKKIEIIGVKGDIFLFKIDCEKTIQILNKSEIDVNKTCDYAIFYMKNNKLCATLCELKSDNPKAKKYFYQLAISKVIVEALFEIVKMKKKVGAGKIRQILLCTDYPKARLTKNGIHRNNNIQYKEITIDNHKLCFNVIVCRDKQQFHIDKFI